MKYRVEGKLIYEVEAEKEKEVFNELADKFARENTTAENEFWNNLDVIREVDETIEAKADLKRKYGDE